MTCMNCKIECIYEVEMIFRMYLLAAWIKCFQKVHCIDCPQNFEGLNLFSLEMYVKNLPSNLVPKVAHTQSKA